MPCNRLETMQCPQDFRVTQMWSLVPQGTPLYTRLRDQHDAALPQRGKSNRAATKMRLGRDPEKPQISPTDRRLPAAGVRASPDPGPSARMYRPARARP